MPHVIKWKIKGCLQVQQDGDPQDQGQEFKGKMTFQSRRPSLYRNLRWFSVIWHLLPPFCWFEWVPWLSWFELTGSNTLWPDMKEELVTTEAWHLLEKWGWRWSFPLPTFLGLCNSSPPNPWGSASLSARLHLSQASCLNTSISCLSLCLSLNSFCAETQRTWASVSPVTRWEILISKSGFKSQPEIWLGLSQRHFWFQLNRSFPFSPEYHCTVWTIHSLPEGPLGPF